MKPIILCVDDEPDNVEALERLFRKDYKVLKALSGDEGLALLDENPEVAIIISDQRMPEMTGVEMLAKSVKSHPECIRILLTGYTDIDSVVGAINSGQVYRYITKPWDPIDLKNTIDKAAEKYQLRRELVQKNQKLKVALDELKILDQAKSNFMILINHELKTPLTVLSSFLELLAESKLSAEQKKYIDRISTSKDKLQRIIDDVLLLVSAETGLMKLSKKKVNIQKLLSDFDQGFSEQLKKKTQTLEFDLDDINVKADGEKIKEVLKRLTENAIKFGNDKSSIKIACHRDKGKAKLVVTNKGKAIPKKSVEKILKPFALDEDIMNHTQGMGIGLSLSQAILKNHGSQLDIDSKKSEVSVGFQLDLV